MDVAGSAAATRMHNVKAVAHVCSAEHEGATVDCGANVVAVVLGSKVTFEGARDPVGTGRNVVGCTAKPDRDRHVEYVSTHAAAGAPSPRRPVQHVPYP